MNKDPFLQARSSVPRGPGTIPLSPEPDKRNHPQGGGGGDVKTLGFSRPTTAPSQGLGHSI